MLSSTLDAEEHARLLVRAREPELRARPGRQMCHVSPEELDSARRRRKVARYHVEQRRLAGTVQPEYRPPLAVRDLQIDVADGMETAETPADPPEQEGRRGASRLSSGFRH